jgi:8-amino-7-oxononanoate synthase
MRRDPAALRAALAELDRRELRRERRRSDPPGSPAPGAPEGAATLARIGGRAVVNFCSNDYLGLARHPEVSAALIAVATREGVGSGASHLVTGHGLEHERLEEALADFTRRPRALLFSSGYLANLGVIAALAQRGDLLLEDRLDHASLIDAGRVSGARLRRYPHGDAAAAEAALAANGSANAVLATDGVFSMDGDLAPLPALGAATRRHGAWLVVDDAHGLGVLGPGGRGSVEHFGLDTNDVPLLIGTLGKAFGTCGAFVAGDAEVIEYLLQSCRTYRYTTAPPQALAAATLAALRVADRDRWRRERVLALTRRFRSAAMRAGIALGSSPTPIQPLRIGDAGRALAVSRGLFERGYWVTAIRPPTVPAGTARLRVTLSAAHTEAQVDGLVTALAESLAESLAQSGAEGAAPRRPAPTSA